MRLNFLFLLLSILLTTGRAKSQVQHEETPQVLENLFDRLINNYNDNERIRINDSIRLIIDAYVKSDSVFTHKFTNLRYLGQITSPDSLIKIITWNLVLENQPGRYFTYFIRRQNESTENKIYRLAASYSEKQISVDSIYTGTDWYGALYYDLKPYIIENKHFWVLLGIDYGNPSISRKIIDVLSFKEDGSIIFGKDWFMEGNQKKYREVFEYASNAMMSLRFRSDNSIVFDHLVPFSPSRKDDRQFYGPDYSVDAYNFTDGLWKLVINVEVRNQ
jgi:hypothetical protein